MTYSVFNTRVRDLMQSDDMPLDEARYTVSADMEAEGWGDLLKSDPGYLAWTRKYAEQTDHELEEAP